MNKTNAILDPNTTHITPEMYAAMYQESLENPEKFWNEQAALFVDWFEPWNQTMREDLSKGEIEWFIGGKTNVSYNCIDRHLATRGSQVAILWEGENGDTRRITYNELSQQVNQFANAMKNRGIEKGDRVCIYMPMIPEAAVAMLACTRIGAIHSVVFGGFSIDALADRIQDAECCAVVTADFGNRAGKKIPLKANVDQALESCPTVHTTFVVRDYNATAPTHPRDIAFCDATSKEWIACEPEVMDAEDPLFILYTSGSTGKPKGVLHTTGGYLTYAAMTHKYAFDYHDGDVYWCTADIGWVTGHSYIIYGPLANGATTLMFEGVPTYPDASRFWEIVDKHKVNIFYTAPTAIRSLMAAGDEYVTRTSRESLRILGTVGEPINPEAWRWYFKVVGNGKCPIVDTWWQTETGGFMITPLPGATITKPGSATKPFFGVEPAIVDDTGTELEGAASGRLVIKHSWPGMMRGLWGDKQRFMDTYLNVIPEVYFTGDGAKRDEDGDFWITGRVDDVLNVSGHRMGTAEVESALVLHTHVAEAAVVGYPHNIKGQGIYAYVTLNNGIEGNPELISELIAQVRSEIGPIAKPDVIHFTPGLPKTRSGKIMRRILRKIAENDTDNFGDTTTLTDPGIVDLLVANHQEIVAASTTS